MQLHVITLDKQVISSSPINLAIMKSQAFLVLSSVLLLASGCRGPKLMGYDEFAALGTVRLPQKLYLASKGKELLYFGTYHSNNPKDSLFLTIKEEFMKFQPDYVLYEGGNWPIFNDPDSTVLVSGEPGFVISLCQKSQKENRSIEPNEEDEYKFLLRKHEFNWVVLMYLCRQVDQQQRFMALHHTTDEQFAKNIGYFLNQLKRKGMPLEKSQMDYAYWKGVYQRLLKKELDWRTFNPNEYYPNFSLTPMNEINRSSDNFRNRYMIDNILNSFSTHTKVMVVVGGGHLIVQEELLKYRFNKR